MLLVDSCPCLKSHIASAGNCITSVPKLRTRMIMSEKQNDGTVAMLYGDVEDGNFHAVEDHLPTLPNTVSFTRRNTVCFGISLFLFFYFFIFKLKIEGISLLNDRSGPMSSY